jgi:hypothetical protein
MNDATSWIDPELVSAGQLLQSRGLVAPDRTQASLSEVRAATDRIGAFLGEGSVPRRRGIARSGRMLFGKTRPLPLAADRRSSLTYGGGQL